MKHIYVMTDQDEDFSYFDQVWGATIDEVDLEEFCPEALKGMPKHFHRMKIEAAALIKAKTKITQQELAEKCNISQGYLSSILSAYSFSWQDFQRLFENVSNIFINSEIEYQSEQDGLSTTMEFYEFHEFEEFFKAFADGDVAGIVSAINYYGASYQSAMELVWVMSPFFDDTIDSLRQELFSLFDSA